MKTQIKHFLGTPSRKLAGLHPILYSVFGSSAINHETGEINIESIRSGKLKKTEFESEHDYNLVRELAVKQEFEDHFVIGTILWIATIGIGAVIIKTIIDTLI